MELRFAMTEGFVEKNLGTSPDSMQHIAIEVTDMKKSIDFYRKILGMKLTEQHEAGEIKEIPVALSFLRLKHSKSHHDLVLVHNPNKKYHAKDKCLAPNFHHMGFCFKEKKSWELQLAHIESNQVKVIRGPVVHSPFQKGGEGSWGENKSFYILDPDGHRIEFFCDMATIDGDGFYRDENNLLIHEEAKVSEL